MELNKRRTLEKVAAAGSVASALGGAAYFLAKRHNKQSLVLKPEPEILNSDKLEDHKRLLINRTALAIICIQHPDRKNLMADLEESKHHIDFSTGYLKHYGLIYRAIPEKSSGIPPHYIPVVELIDCLRNTDDFPYMETALQERIAKNSI